MKTPIALIAVVLTAFASEAFASGACPCQPPIPPKSKAGVRAKGLDNSKYALGKQIYSGRLPVPDRANAKLAKSQAPRLQAAAPNLSGLAGKLTEDQLSALEYYVANRKP